uniref:Uncharacterized protein n=1 Tax=Rhizophora mucronata TaxID=61149 RepID=A0A2P2IVK0_RHIMU
MALLMKKECMGNQTWFKKGLSLKKWMGLWGSTENGYRKKKKRITLLFQIVL